MDSFLMVAASIGLGVVGAFTPCALGINTLFLTYLAGKGRRARLTQSGLITGIRALFFTAVGILFALFGQSVGSFVLAYRLVISLLIIAVGIAFIANAFVAIPMPRFRLVRTGSETGSVLALGTLFGLDVPACISPLLIGILAQTVLVGDWVSGAISLFLFGIGMSLPLVAVAVFEGANLTLVKWAVRWRVPVYTITGAVFVLLGAAEFSPRVLRFYSEILRWVIPAGVSLL